MSDPRLDPAMRDALDRFTVPSLPAGFADRVVAAAGARPAPLPARPLPRGGARRGWVRGHRVIVGVVAFSLMSAAAAATGMLGNVARDVPVIGALIASVTPARPEPKPKKAALAKPAPVEAVPALADAPSFEAALPVLQTPREVRREIVAQRLADRIERRAEHRREFGLPPRPLRPVQIAPVLRRVPPAERAALVERVREIRQERKAIHGPVPERPPELPDRVIAPIAPQTELATAPAVGLPDASDGDAQSAESLRNPERLDQLRRLRAIRELRERRREMRRQRQQQ